jgi:DNA-binding response OmpR family regulator
MGWTPGGVEISQNLAAQGVCRLDQVCTREEIMAALYPAETLDPDKAGADNRVDSLVRRLRKAIEPAPGHPRYLLTLRGHGYKLVDMPDAPAPP